MPFFWAKFENIHGHTFRFDTRIYFTDIVELEVNDVCIGAVVGKNPGSATGAVCGKLVPVTPDPTLKSIKGGVENAYMHKYSVCPAPNEYVQVLNLFFLCDPNLSTAIKKQRVLPSITDPTENKDFPWVWYAWGSSNSYLNALKGRFVGKGRKLVYLDNSGSFYNRFPHPPVLARHPLILKHALISSALQTVI